MGAQEDDLEVKSVTWTLDDIGDMRDLQDALFEAGIPSSVWRAVPETPPAQQGRMEIPIIRNSPVLVTEFGTKLRVVTVDGVVNSIDIVDS